MYKNLGLINIFILKSQLFYEKKYLIWPSWVAITSVSLKLWNPKDLWRRNHLHQIIHTKNNFSSKSLKIWFRYWKIWFYIYSFHCNSKLKIFWEFTTYLIYIRLKLHRIFFDNKLSRVKETSYRILLYLYTKSVYNGAKSW